MSTPEIESLRQLFKDGKLLMWNPDEDNCKVITSITKREDEVDLCANFSDGRYVSLFDCEASDFIIAFRLIENK